MKGCPRCFFFGKKKQHYYLLLKLKIKSTDFKINLSKYKTKLFFKLPAVEVKRTSGSRSSAVRIFIRRISPPAHCIVQIYMRFHDFLSIIMGLASYFDYFCSFNTLEAVCNSCASEFFYDFFSSLAKPRLISQSGWTSTFCVQQKIIKKIIGFNLITD